MTDVDGFVMRIGVLERQLAEARAQITAKDAEIERYRRALEDICYVTFESDGSWGIARAALAQPAPAQEDKP